MAGAQCNGSDRGADDELSSLHKSPLRERCARTARSMSGFASLGNDGLIVRFRCVCRIGRAGVAARRRELAPGCERFTERRPYVVTPWRVRYRTDARRVIGGVL